MTLSSCQGAQKTGGENSAFRGRNLHTECTAFSQMHVLKNFFLGGNGQFFRKSLGLEHQYAVERM